MNDEKAAQEMQAIFEKLDLYLQKYEDMKPNDITAEMLMERYGWKNRESLRIAMKPLVDKGIVEKVRVNDTSAHNKYRTVYRIVEK